MSLILNEKVWTHGHLFGAVGGGAMGFNAASARLGNTVARFRCVGSIDVDAAACRAFERNVGVPATTLDLFDLDQYQAWHGRMPPPEWREALPEDIQRAMGWESPDVGFLSAPCKGFSGLLPESSSKLPRYEALNRLTLRGVWLWLEAFKHDPTSIIFFENVPRIMVRGRGLLDQIAGLFKAYGYAWSETTHDCGVIGGLGQSRKRFLGVARHMEKVPPFLYEPPQRRLRGVGEILDLLPMPGDTLNGGPMHRIPALQWKTWVRLAFVEPGKDWRSLNSLAVEDGYLKDFAIAPETDWQGGVLGVNRWEDHTGVVPGRSSPTNGAHSVADPRPLQGNQTYHQYGVKPWTATAGAVSGQSTPGGGPYAVADVRFGEDRTPFSNVFRIVPWRNEATAITSAKGALAAVADPSGSHNRHVNGKYRVTPYDGASNGVIAASTTGNGASAVADPRTTHGPGAHTNKHRVVPYTDRAPTIATSDRVGSGALSVADPPERPNGILAVADVRPAGLSKDGRTAKYADHYGVLAYDGTSKVVSGHSSIDNSYAAVADGRLEALLPALNEQLVCVIIARDGTWHRPFTTLDLAALQSLVDPEDPLNFHLEGKSDSAFREWIGNAVPPDAAQAMGEVALQTLLLAEAGESFMLSNTPIWVRPLAIAMAVDTSRQVPA